MFICLNYHGHANTVQIIYVALDGCSDGEIQLRPALNEREGTVQICVGGVMGTICDTFWSSQDAAVACKQLGLPFLGVLPL